MTLGKAAGAELQGRSSLEAAGSTCDLRASWLCESGTGNRVTWLSEPLSREPAAGAEASHLAFVVQLLSC